MRSLQTELMDKGLRKAVTDEIEQTNIWTSNRVTERLTDRELRELMGTNRGTHRRVKGRVKQR